MDKEINTPETPKDEAVSPPAMGQLEKKDTKIKAKLDTNKALAALDKEIHTPETSKAEPAPKPVLVKPQKKVAEAPAKPAPKPEPKTTPEMASMIHNIIASSRANDKGLSKQT